MISFYFILSFCSRLNWAGGKHIMQKYHNLHTQKVNKQHNHLWNLTSRSFSRKNTTNNNKAKVTPFGIFEIERREANRLLPKLASNWKS